MKSALTLVALATVSTLSTTAPAVESVRVRGSKIVVADIVPNCPVEACEVEVARAPLPGRTSMVVRAEVVRALEAAGIDATTVPIPKNLRVVRPSRRPSEVELRAKVEQAVSAVLPQNARLVSLGAMPSLEVPLGEYEVHARWTAGDSMSRRVTVPWTLRSDGDEFGRWQSSADIVYETYLPVLVADLPAGSIVKETDVELRPISLSKRLSDVAGEIVQVIGRRLRKDTTAHEPISLSELEEIPIVRRGDGIVLESVHGSIRITTSAVAREDGPLGARIRVVAGSSQKLLWAVVLAPGKATVSP